MAHIHEKIDFTASVYIVHDGKVLLHKHKKLGIWLPPGGHIELEEDPNVAAIREAKEETGIDIELVGNIMPKYPDQSDEQELIPPKFLNRHFFNETHEHVDLVYFGRVRGGGEVRPEEEDGEVRWFTREDIEKSELKQRIKIYALSALDELA